MKIIFVVGLIIGLVILMCIVRQAFQFKMIKCAKYYNLYRSRGDHHKAVLYRNRYVFYKQVVNMLFGRSYRSYKHEYRHTIETGYPSSKK